MDKPVYDYGCAMVYVDFPDIGNLQSIISKNDLHEKGLETEPHVTLLYGLIPNKETKYQVESIISKYTFNTFRTSTVECFENEEFDVLKFSIYNRLFNSINKDLKDLPFESKYPNYSAHLTIAYLKKGLGNKYVKLFKEKGLESFYLKPTHVIYSYPKNNKNNKYKIEINMPLDKNSSIEDFVKDFVKSKAPQFKRKSDKEIRDMAIAAYYDTQKEVKESFKTAFKARIENISEQKGKYSHINFKPPESVSKAAERGLEYRRKNKGKGGLSAKQASKQGIGSGVQRAVNLKNRDTVSPKVINQMVSFFARHAKNKGVEKGKQPWEDKGRIAWLLWGGDSGKSWADKIKRQLDAADKKANNEELNRVEKLIKENYSSELISIVVSPDTVFKKFKEMELKSHYSHLTTSSFAKHEALGKYYEGLQAITDSLMETFLTNAPLKYDFMSGKVLEVEFGMDILHCIHKFSSYLKVCISIVSDEVVKDVLIEAERLTQKTIYSLTLT